MANERDNCMLRVIVIAEMNFLFYAEVRKGQRKQFIVIIVYLGFICIFLFCFLSVEYRPSLSPQPSRLTAAPGATSCFLRYQERENSCPSIWSKNPAIHSDWAAIVHVFIPEHLLSKMFNSLFLLTGTF